MIELVRGFDHFNHRKSISSKCTEAGIYPDELDCSLFHHCYEDNRHDIIQCPAELRFDPKTYLCLPTQLVFLLFSRKRKSIKSSIEFNLG